MTTTPHPDDLVDDVARALIPTLDVIARKALAEPEPLPEPVCHIDGKRAPWVGWAHYFPDGSTSPRVVRLDLCSDHADTFHRRYRLDRLRFNARPVFKFTLQERP
jgi:hypothetical protein